MSATATIGSILPHSHRPVSDWLSGWVQQRRGRPKLVAREIGCTHHAIYQRAKTGAAWTADDLARLLASDPQLRADFEALLGELSACTSA